MEIRVMALTEPSLRYECLLQIARPETRVRVVTPHRPTAKQGG